MYFGANVGPKKRKGKKPRPVRNVPEEDMALEIDIKIIQEFGNLQINAPNFMH